jgi:hypothetical protein
MNLTGIIAISGKPGLFKVLSQAKNSIIVESLTDGKRSPAYATDRISALEDISVYTYDEDQPLNKIFRSIYDKESGEACISHKESEAKLVSYLLEVLPNYDAERVYASDIKKVFQWYNLLHASKNLILNEEEVEEAISESGETSEKKVAGKKPAAKKKTITAPKAAVKPAKSVGKSSGGMKAKTTVQRKSGSN